MAYARSGQSPDPRTWQPLEQHLRAVANLARGFAAPWGAGELAYLAGLLHDLGKFHPDFQQMLLEVGRGGPKRRVDHSSAGAVHVRRWFGEVAAKVPQLEAPLTLAGLALESSIAGHHAGLPEAPAALDFRLDERANLYEQVCADAAAREFLLQGLPVPPAFVFSQTERERRSKCEFMARMLLSALVDADRLDAEAAGEVDLPAPTRSARIRASYNDIASLTEAVDTAIDAKVSGLSERPMELAERAVFRYRQEVLKACRDAALLSPGIFTLDVATGGGKTLSTLSFALRHARAHGKRRVIVVIPFTSIIEQTARVYREALGAGFSFNLLEHHSALGEDAAGEGQDPTSTRWRLAAENWDAPLIVTTGVQFFESLFSDSASRCRKLHNVAGSVVILDEAQTLPPELLHPTIWAVNELAAGYGVTFVFSTATQPALEPPFPAVSGARSIVPSTLERPPDRVRVESCGPESVDWPALAGELARDDNRQVLCITHRRRDAHDLTLALDTALGTTETIHLAGSMHAAHRAARIEEIRMRLGDGAPCRVISTQLVEAGVDLDFPVVYRALAGIDSLVQAAGRANREGKLGVQGGVLRVYRPPTRPPSGLPRLGADVAGTLLRAAEMDGTTLALFDPATSRAFFRDYYGRIGDQDQGLAAMREEFRFADTARTYRFIKDGGLTVLVPDVEIEADLQAVAQGRCVRWRRLQRFGVAVYPGQLEGLFAAGALAPLIPGEQPRDARVFLLLRSALYNGRFGLESGAPAALSADETII